MIHADDCLLNPTKISTSIYDASVYCFRYHALCYVLARHKTSFFKFLSAQTVLGWHQWHQCWWQPKTVWALNWVVLSSYFNLMFLLLWPVVISHPDGYFFIHNLSMSMTMMHLLTEKAANSCCKENSSNWSISIESYQTSEVSRRTRCTSSPSCER